MAHNIEDVVSWRRITSSIAHVILDNPPANALGIDTIDALSSAVDELQSDEKLRVIVFSSVVPRFFAAGADIKHMSLIDAQSFVAYGRRLRNLVNAISEVTQLTVAAIDGMAMGGGLELAMACTLRVATRSSCFALPEVKIGLIPGAGGTQRLPRLVGRGRALDLMLTGRSIDANEAFSMGLIDRMVDDGTAESEAFLLANKLCESSSLAQRSIVRAVDRSFDATLREGLEFEAEQEDGLFEQGEAAEGIAAFVEKRAPRFA